MHSAALLRNWSKLGNCASISILCYLAMSKIWNSRRAGLGWPAPVSCGALSVWDAPRGARTRTGCGVLWHSHPNTTLIGVLLRLPTASGLPLQGNGDFGTSAFFGSSRTSWCLFVLITWGSEGKAQWLVEKLNAEHLLGVAQFVTRQKRFEFNRAVFLRAV